MRLFCLIIDTGALNVCIAFFVTNRWWNTGGSASRLDKGRLFLIEIGEKLVYPFMNKRAAKRWFRTARQLLEHLFACESSRKRI
jgi:hypothetical protein